MKICIATPTTIGVSETFIQAIVDGLGGQAIHISGDDLTYTCRHSPIDDEYAFQATWKSRALNLLPRFMEFRVRRKLCQSKNKAEQLAQFLLKNDVTVVLAEYGTQAADFLEACQIARIPLVPHFHGFEVSRRSTVDLYRERYSRLFNYCDRIIAVSQRMKNDLVGLGCDSSKIAHVVYAPHSSFFGLSPNYQSRHVVMVGRLTDQKAPHLSILAFSKAIQRCPDLRLRIVGEGELRSVCRDLIRALGIADRVDLLGAGSREMVQKELSGAFLFVQHSVEAANGDREGTPVAILEAGASGLPVVSTKHAGIPDVVIPNETGVLVSEGDVEAMADAICRFAHDRMLAERMGVSARSHIMQNYTMDRHINDIRQVLTESVEQFSKRAGASA